MAKRKRFAIKIEFSGEYKETDGNKELGKKVEEFFFKESESSLLNALTEHLNSEKDGLTIKNSSVSKIRLSYLGNDEYQDDTWDGAQ